MDEDINLAEVKHVRVAKKVEMISNNMMQLTHTKHFLMNDNSLVERVATTTRKVPERPI